MTEIIFKNRITQESPYIIKQLKSLWIEMNSDKKQTQNKCFIISASSCFRIEFSFSSVISFSPQITYKFGYFVKIIKET